MKTLPKAVPKSTRMSLRILANRSDKSTRNRIKLYTEWLEIRGKDWRTPDLEAWRDHLFAQSLSPKTVSAYLSSVRSIYRRFLKHRQTRDFLYCFTPDDASPADKKAFVDEIVIRIENAIDPETSRVKITKLQDITDSAHLRLTPHQAEALISSPDASTLKGIRDTAILSLLLCTGVREQELVDLTVEDLRQELSGELALHVRHGKGNKSRLIPYGALDWCLAVVDRWLEKAGIEDGPVFQSVYKGDEKLRPGKLSTRGVQMIISEYPIAINGHTAKARPHDLRRTYARLQYDASMDLVALQQNLGHGSMKTTLGYIGTLDVAKRRAKAAISFDLSKLEVRT